MAHQDRLINDAIRAQPVARLQGYPLAICQYVAAGKRIGAGEAIALDFFAAEAIGRICAK